MRLEKKAVSLINLSFADKFFCCIFVDAKASTTCEKSTQQIHLFSHIFQLAFRICVIFKRYVQLKLLDKGVDWLVKC